MSEFKWMTVCIIVWLSWLILLICMNPAHAKNYVPEYIGQKDDYNEEKLRNDPTVLVSGQTNRDSNILISGQGNRDSSVLVANIPHYYSKALQELKSKTYQNPIKNLESEILLFTYDNTPKTFAESKTIDELKITKTGNCYEIARYVWSILFAKGYRTYLLNLEFENSKVSHVITVFQEHNGTWSMFQASSNEDKGYFTSNSLSMGDLIKDKFGSTKNIEILK